MHTRTSSAGSSQLVVDSGLAQAACSRVSALITDNTTEASLVCLRVGAVYERSGGLQCVRDAERARHWPAGKHTALTRPNGKR